MFKFYDIFETIYLVNWFVLCLMSYVMLYLTKEFKCRLTEVIKRFEEYLCKKIPRTNQNHLQNSRQSSFTLTCCVKIISLSLLQKKKIIRNIREFFHCFTIIFSHYLVDCLKMILLLTNLSLMYVSLIDY